MIERRGLARPIVVRPTEGGRWTVSVPGLITTHDGAAYSTLAARGLSYDSALDAEIAGVRQWRAEYQRRQRQGVALEPEAALLRVCEAPLRGPVPPRDSGRPPLPEALTGQMPLASDTFERKALRRARSRGSLGRGDQTILRDYLARAEAVGSLPDDYEALRAIADGDPADA